MRPAAGAPSRLRLLLLAGPREDEIRAAQAEAEARAAQGDNAGALMTLDRLLRAARELNLAALELLLHHSRAWVSLSASGPAPVARGLYELARSALPAETRAPLERLLRAARQIRQGEGLGGAGVRSAAPRPGRPPEPEPPRPHLPQGTAPPRLRRAVWRQLSGAATECTGAIQRRPLVGDLPD